MANVNQVMGWIVWSVIGLWRILEGTRVVPGLQGACLRGTDKLWLCRRVCAATGPKGIADADRIAAALIGRVQENRRPRLHLEDKAGLPAAQNGIADATVVQESLANAKGKLILGRKGKAVPDVLRTCAIVIAETKKIRIAISAILRLANGAEGIVQAV